MEKRKKKKDTLVTKRHMGKHVKNGCIELNSSSSTKMVCQIFQLIDVIQGTFQTS